MPRLKEVSERITVTLPRTMVMDYREIARMAGCSLSKAIRLRLEIRGSIVAVPESVMEDLQTIHNLLAYAVKWGHFDPQLLATWRERVAMYDRLLDYDSETSFIKKERKRRSSQKKKDEPTAKKKAAALETKAVAHPESGAVGC